MLLNIYKLDSIGEDPLTILAAGVHVVGRGPLLHCEDKRVSRHHASIEVGQDIANITSVHINPCFLRKANSKTVTILSKDTTEQLQEGDQFAFLPDSFWFKVKVVLENGLDQVDFESTSEQPLKRPHVGVDDDVKEKRLKFENAEADNDDNVSNASFIVTWDTEAGASTSNERNNLNTEGDIKIEPSPDIELPPDIDDGKENGTNSLADSQQNKEIKTEVKNEVDDNTKPESNASPRNDDGSSPDKAGPSKPKPRRERCWYGSSCYRKNAVHRDDYSHPGDTDYESDPNDDRPSCSFGAACFRKNKDHRRQCKHPPQVPPSKQKLRKKKNPTKRDDYVDLSNLSDEEEDPYQTDGDSDEYVAESSESDPDWEASQGVDESEDVKMMISESKKFAKK